jgi:hypothetical protein
MNLLVSKKSWLLSPVLFILGVICLVIAWASVDPVLLRSFFDCDGRSFFEAMTISVYALIVPAVWLACPFGGSVRRKALLASAVTLVVVAAVMKQLDLHIDALSGIYPDTVAGFKGTPFKMRFLRADGVPFGAKIFVVLFLFSLFGVFGLLLAGYSAVFIRGLIKLHPVAWSVACLGVSGVMVQICDRLPAWIRSSMGWTKETAPVAFTSLCTALEEGGEMMLALFALTAILQAHLLYSDQGEKYRIDG